ncbi:DUF6957 family protein [Colwellia psychrerythraea]|uniref:DUF6957 domain-containing protein n=1 Tax=Colwellia psychrerythraea TaxID=28229 RepID=A0A099KJ87_COLPS|nr:hypothetical protein [Colwellia psychrerythraea]KGJ89608.1 hypothetical protein ND2E_3799 [Colwellia psychrerythraea]
MDNYDYIVVIAKLAKAFKNDGETVGFGCEESSLPYQINIYRKINGSKTYCAAKAWCLWQIQSPLIDSGEHPEVIMLKADHVIEDELGRFPVGGWVRSSPILAVYDNCIFETGNTFYIAVGEGMQKQISAEDASSFF